MTTNLDAGSVRFAAVVSAEKRCAELPTTEKPVTATIPRGAWVTMITPFVESDGQLVIDWPHVDALVDFYSEQGIDGIFAVCQSSEMYFLSDDERIELATRVLARAKQQTERRAENGKAELAVIAGGTFPEHTPVARAEFIKRMAATGVAAVVVIASALFGTDASAANVTDDDWKKAVAELIDLTPGVPLGLYECPMPHHRILDAKTLLWCVETGRFLFHKDTCCTLDGLRAKLDALKASASPHAKTFQLFNANVATLTASLRMGAAGFCGIAANCYPALFATICSKHDTAAPAAAVDALQRVASVCEPTVAHKYPQSAKLFLRNTRPELFSKMTGHCRVKEHEWVDEELMRLEHLQPVVDGFTRQ